MKQKVKSIIFFMIKYLIMIFLVCLFFANLSYYLKNKDFINLCLIDKYYSKNEAKMIITLLPSIITTCTIALSLTSEKYYGVDSFTFRRLRKGLSINFTGMFIIDVLLFALYLASSILGFKFCIFIIDVASLIYSLWLIIQEIPLLSKRKGYLNWIIKRILNNNNYQGGNNSDGKIKDTILQSFYFKSGLKNTYSNFKRRNKEENKVLLDKLLDINKDFLYKICDKKDYLMSSKETNLEDITILDAIKFSFDSLKDIFKFDKEFDVLEIFDGSDNYYKISMIILKLKEVCDFLSLSSSYQKFIDELFLSFDEKEIYKNEKYNDFKFKILNRIIFGSQDKNISLFFAKSLKRAFFFESNAQNNKYYSLFLSIYCYYLHLVSVPSFKSIIISFINENLDSSSNNPFTFKNNIREIIFKLSFEELFQCLKFIFKYINFDYDVNYYYCFDSLSDNKIYKSKSDFSKEFIINCWLEIIFYGNVNTQDAEKALKILGELNPEDQVFLANLLNQWYVGNGIKSISSKTSYVYFYDLNKIDSLDQDTLDKIKTRRQDTLVKNEILNQKKNNDSTNIDADIIKNIKEAFEFVNNKFGNNNLDFKVLNYRFLFSDVFEININDKEDLKKYFEKEFYLIFYYEIFDNLNERNFEKVPFNSNDLIKDGFLYATNDMKYSPNYDEIKDKLNISDIMFNDKTIFWKEGAIKFNLVFNENYIFEEQLNNTQINQKIDKEYTVNNGLYKFNGNNSSNNVFISREKLYQIIKDNYRNIKIIFEYYLEIKEDEIIEIERK